MNNNDNPTRVVINLDGDFDDIDDDDITLPSLPAQSITIVEESTAVSDESAAKLAVNTKRDSAAYDEAGDVSHIDEANVKTQFDDIALGAPIVTPETLDNSEVRANPTTADSDIGKTINTAPSVNVPIMPLQAQLGESVSHNTQSDKAQIAEKKTIKTNDVELTGKDDQAPQKGSWFNRMKSGLSKSRKNLAEGMVSILIGGKEIDDELLEEVEDQLLVADIGVNATNRIIKSLTEQTARGDLIYAHSLYKALQNELVDILTPKVAPLVIDTTKKPFVILVVGVNGVGKTTTIGKLAKRLQGEGKSVMLAAGDTFRAAATEQLQIWGERNNIAVVAQGHGSDSASVIFDAMQSAKAKNIDVLIADTAGRLQNKTHLMAELEKVVRVMRKADESAPHEGMIVLDAGTGQNAINQVELFNKAVPLTGITITKLDGTAKGGVVFNIAETTDVPIRYIGVGESIDDLRAFSPKQFVAALFETDDKE